MPLFGEYGLLVLHIVVVVTSLIAAVLVVFSKPLRFHSTAVCLSGAVCAGMFLVAAPALEKSGEVGIFYCPWLDCCGILFGGYHLLLCLALALQVSRVASGQQAKTARPGTDKLSSQRE
jgi:hypothetical protein